MRYEVRWRDSGLHIEGWKDIEEILTHKTAIVSTCGYLVYEDEEHIYMALTKHEEESQYYGIQVIWKNDIVSKERLRER